MSGMPAWWIVFAVVTGVGLMIALHFFGQGLWYMAHAQQQRDADSRNTAAYYHRHRIAARIIALVVAPAAGIAVFFAMLAAWGGSAT